MQPAFHPEVHQVFNEEAKKREAHIPLRKDDGHKLTLNLGVFNDGLKGSLGFRRLFQESEEWQLGVQRTVFDMMRYYVTRTC